MNRTAGADRHHQADHRRQLQLAEGDTLAERLERGRLAVHAALALAAQITLALEAAHDRGIIYRDLNPRTSNSRRCSTAATTRT